MVVAARDRAADVGLPDGAQHDLLHEPGKNRRRVPFLQTASAAPRRRRADADAAFAALTARSAPPGLPVSCRILPDAAPAPCSRFGNHARRSAAMVTAPAPPPRAGSNSKNRG